MGELLCIYFVWSLATGATLPVEPDGFMPFQHHYYLWKAVGFGGLGVFQARWIVQWIYSEAHHESRVPTVFWWLSLCGSLMELSYFLRQQDSVGILGCMGGITYVRNLMLVYGKKKRDRESGLATNLRE
ncbi:MAG TPA: lipid-A-disaccharide synthase N-terminal domain-containing protein [Tepidisphaeraceae bacterium]|jgi:lipid-A-disaccharide synthase-like uncharacterized protein|nr:lipid-A-disaccharide synthase N-terminal domain-containing protein [Tepidisphaeraceae bacterium]